MRLAFLAALLVLTGCTHTPSTDMSRYARNFAQGNAPLPEADGGQLTVTYFGTSSLLFDDGADQILIDGFLTRPSLDDTVATLLSTNQAVVDEVLRDAQATRMRAVIVAHSHYDHAMDAAYIASSRRIMLYGSRSTRQLGLGGGVPKGRIRVFEPDEPIRIAGFTVTPFGSVHSRPAFYNNDLGEEITAPLSQPARADAYREGGSYDFLIEHGTMRIMVIPGANFVPGAMARRGAHIVFLGIGTLGSRHSSFRDAFYCETVAALRPSLLIPIHWDNFFRPLTRPLRATPRGLDNVRAALDFLIPRAEGDGIAVTLLQAQQRFVLPTVGMSAIVRAPVPSCPQPAHP